MKNTPAEAERMLAVLERLVDDFRRDAAALHRAIIDAHPGYPTSTLGGGSGRGGDVSRPTERYALEGSTAAADLGGWYTALDNGYQWLLEASHVRSRHMPAISAVRRCGNPAGCPRRAVAASDRGGLCQSCWRERPRTGEAAA